MYNVQFKQLKYEIILLINAKNIYVKGFHCIRKRNKKIVNIKAGSHKIPFRFVYSVYAKRES